MGFGELPGWGAHGGDSRGRHPKRTGKPLVFPTLCPRCLLHPEMLTKNGCVLYNKSEIVTCFPGFCELFQQIMKPEERVMGAPSLDRSVRGTGVSPGLVIGV